MLPICGVPATIQQGLASYRDLFCRDEGFAHISRYITGLLLSPNKTVHRSPCRSPLLWPCRHTKARRLFLSTVCCDHQDVIGTTDGVTLSRAVVNFVGASVLAMNSTTR